MFGRRSGRFRYFVRWFFNVLPEWCDSRSPGVEINKEQMHDKLLFNEFHKTSRETTTADLKTIKRRKN